MTKADRQTAARRLEPAGGAKGFKSKCGTAEEVSRRAGQCLIPIIEMVEGRFTDPNTDQDIVTHCERFTNCEKCVRAINKECLTGLHKTAVGTFASATRRFRTQECKTEKTRARYLQPMKCAIKKGKEMQAVLRNHTGIAQGLRDLPISPEEKLLKACCLLTSLDKEMEIRYNRECPEHTGTIINIVHAITDDARATLCRNPKCNGALDAAKNNRYKPPQNFMEPFMQILLQLNVD